VGSIAVLNARFAWAGPVPGDALYKRGDDAVLQVTIVNEVSPGLDDGGPPSR
jgi:hypothetical protein